jgi:hypothetical protein
MFVGVARTFKTPGGIFDPFATQCRGNGFAITWSPPAGTAVGSTLPTVCSFAITSTSFGRLAFALGPARLCSGARAFRSHCHGLLQFKGASSLPGRPSELPVGFSWWFDFL